VIFKILKRETAFNIDHVQAGGFFVWGEKLCQRLRGNWVRILFPVEEDLLTASEFINRKIDKVVAIDITIEQ
jgi:hypothetical protein